MTFIADFHIHSKYSRATSKEMDIPNLDKAAQIKGLDILGTGDFTHPLWFSHLKDNLSETAPGIFKYGRTFFILTCEVSNIFYRKGKLRKIHNIIFARSFNIAEKIRDELEKYGDLFSDGRPTLRLDAKDLVKILLEIDEEIIVIPAHVWTPWFSLFGSNSGFDSVEECFGEFTDYIYALETGLSSDPAMNWQVSSLDRFVLVSNSDAHSLGNIGREANVFSGPFDYHKLREILIKKRKDMFLYTIEFFPQEGKYHWDGHRKCNISLSPEEAIRNNNICPKCGELLTLGVMHRVRTLADREEGFVPPQSIPFKRAVPLKEIIAEALGKRATPKSVEELYAKVVKDFGGEIKVLLDTPLEEISKAFPSKLIEGIKRVREGRVKIKCGYDGVYGKVSIFGDNLSEAESGQLSLF